MNICFHLLQDAVNKLGKMYVATREREYIHSVSLENLETGNF